MAKEKQGFIKLNRRFFDNFLWNEARTYSKAEAWLDLIQMARFEASTEIIGGKVIELQRGEIPASRRYLELRWTWGSTKVSNFLKMLTDFKMIKQSLKSGQTTILLLNFGTYNDTQTTDKPPTNQRQTRDKPETNQNKELQEEKELNNFLLEKETKEINLSDQFSEEVFSEDKIPDAEKEKSSAQKEKEIQDLRHSDFFKTMCDYFSQTSEVLQMRAFGDLVRIYNSGKIEEFIIQTNAYMYYKKISLEKVHRFQNYVHEWSNEDWVNKLKNVQKSYGKSTFSTNR